MKSKLPKIVQDYFKVTNAKDVVLSEVWTDHNGWTRQPDIHVSMRKLQNLRAAGVTRFAFTGNGRTADFAAKELF